MTVKNKKKQEYNQLHIAKECVHREICNANIYVKLLFDWVNGILENKDLYKNFAGMFTYIRWAIEAQYVMTLGKLFAVKSGEVGLIALIIEARKMPDEFFEVLLGREQPFTHQQLKQARTDFLKNANSYIQRVREINKQINPLRNIQIAHNYPLRSSNISVTWDKTKKWIVFAEEVFVQAMDATCESTVRVGDFVPTELYSQMKHFVSIWNEMGKNQHSNKQIIERT